MKQPVQALLGRLLQTRQYVVVDIQRDSDAGIVVGTITVGDAPYGIYFDGSYIRVANIGDDKVSKIMD